MRSTIALLASLYLLALPAKATLSLTLDTTDGSWFADITQDIQVAFPPFLSRYQSSWIDTLLTGGSLTSSVADMTYSGTYAGNAVSGTGRITLSSFTGGSGEVRDVQLVFLTGLSGGAGAFTSLAITPVTAFNNEPNYQNMITDDVPAFGPPTNPNFQVIVVPELGSLGLGALALAAGVLFRLRKQRD